MRVQKLRSAAIAMGATAAAYYATQILAVTVVPVAPSPVWFPAGVGLVIVLLFGRHLWPGIVLAAFAFAILPAPLGIGWPLGLSLWSGLVNAGQISLAAWLLSRADFDIAMVRIRDVAAFIGAALFLAPAAGGFLGAVGLVAGGVVPAEALRGVWLTWAFGDALGVACLAPVMFAVWSGRGAPRGRWLRDRSREALAEMLLLSVSVLVTTWFVFGPPAIPIIDTPPYLVIPVLLWAATRFGQPGAAWAILAVTVAGVLGTATGHGPFFTGDEAEDFIRLQLFLALAAGVTLTLGAMVSEREASYRRERETAARFGALIEQSRDGISIGRPDGTLVLYNSAMEQLSGYSMEEVNEHGWFDLVYPDPEERQRAVRIAVDAMSGGAPYVEMPIVRKDGEQRWMAFSTTAIAIGDEPHNLSILTDVTERHEAEDALLRHKEELESLVEQRTQQLQDAVEDLARLNEELASANEELVSMNLELEERNEDLARATAAKSEFLAAMSHELRTPLNSIIGFSDVMRHGMTGEMTEEQNRQMTMISDSGKHLLDLINDVLDLSKIEADRLRPVNAPLDAARLAADMVELIRPQAEAKGLELEVALPGTPITVESDHRMVRQILLNLLSNAVKFTAAGHVRLSVSPLTGDRVRFVVRDTGPGIPSFDQERVFEPFTQRELPERMKPSGTGLGLSISRRLAELLGGTLVLESEDGRGSTFTLTLPCTPPESL